MSDQQVRLSGRSRGCVSSTVVEIFGSTERTEPIAKIKASVATALTPYIDRPGDRRDGFADCLLPQIGLVIGIGPIFDPLRPDLKTRLSR